MKKETNFHGKEDGDVKPNYYEGNDSRAVNEQKEGHETSDKEVPETRYQKTQQKVPVSEAENITTPKTSFSKQFSKTSGAEVKQEVAAKVAMADSDFAGAGVSTPSSVGLRSLSFSGDSGTIIGSAANTPAMSVTDRNKDSGRFERKLDAPNKKINYLASEQVVEEYDNPKPLGQSGNEVQGYYGTPKNISARSQKATGAHPGDPLYQRSLDLQTRDNLVWINGQYLRQEGVTYAAEPTKSTTFDSNGNRIDADIDIGIGNYLVRYMNVKLAKSGAGAYVKSVHFDLIDGTRNDCSSDVINKASQNFIIDVNKAEIARQKIDQNAGRETEPTWSDLGRAVYQPSQTNFLLYLMESELGASVTTDYKFACKQHSLQLNKAAKDGQHLVRPLREMLTGDIADMITSQDYAAGGLYSFNPMDNSNAAVIARRNGSAASMILLEDSGAKYSSKASILTNSKSLRRYIQIADNNMNVFRLKKTFGAILNNVDTFSTIDRDYDPLNPVCATDRVGLVYSINPEKYCGFDRADANSPRVYNTGCGPLVYSYSNRMSNYTVEVLHPYWEGIIRFIEDHANKFMSILSNNSLNEDEVIWRIPLRHSSVTFSLIDFLALGAVPFMQKVRINSMRDVIDYETNFEYPYDLITIKDFNPTNAVNYTFKDIDSPLETRRMIPSVDITWKYPEFFWGLGRNTSGSNANMYVCPFYMNEHDFNPIPRSGGNSGFTYEEFSGNVTMPVIRSGVRLAQLDSMYAMSERDIRLCLDRMIRIPGNRVGGNESYMVYKYSQASDGIPVIKGGFTVKEFLSTPRELGWSCVAPGGVLRCQDNFNNAEAADSNFAYEYQRTASENADITTDTSYRAYSWYGKDHYEQSILAAASINIDRAQAFAQNWDCSPAVFMNKPYSGSSVTGFKVRRDIGFYLSMNQCISINTGNTAAFITNAGYFHPFTTGLNSNGQKNGLQVQVSSPLASCVGIAKGLWGRIQKVSFAISPYDTCDFDGANGGSQFDPYDMLYAFGLAGFLASDYTEDLYNRLNECQNQGWLYTSDPFVEASPLFKDGLKYTVNV